jgi:hypothetical protein
MTMAGNPDERIRRRAYQIWLEEGCPVGRDRAHWDMASELVAIEDGQRQTLRPPGPASGEPVEPPEAYENQGDFPELTDQGESQNGPKRRRRAAAAEPRRSM